MPTLNKGSAPGPRVLLAAVGNANDERTWSGIPHHLLTYGRALHVIDVGLGLETTRLHWKLRRIAWNALRLATRFERGGYQFSNVFLERLWRPANILPDDTLINVFPIYPAQLFERHTGSKWFYIDQTLNQAFAQYGLAVPAGVASDAIERERRQYHAAAGVIAHSAWAAQDVMNTYAVPHEKVHVAIAGANLDRTVLAKWEEGRTFEERSPNRLLRLVFVGKEWQRKGLDRLLRATAIARARGAAAEVVIIGLDPRSLPLELARAAGTVWAGFIDKRHDLSRFLDTIAGCDVGCLLSRAEAGGISLREFCRLGLPTIAPDVGGAPEYVIREASDLVGPDASDENIAEIIFRLAGDRKELTRRRRVAFERRHEASWDDAIQRIGSLIGRPVAATVD